jgi:hypothetical protein
MLYHLCKLLQEVPWIVTLTSTAWMISIVWLIHYLGIFLLVGTMVIVDLRVLGVAGRNQRIGQLAGQLFPWAWTGLGMVIPSGFLMFAGQATILYPEPVFRIKLWVLLVALAVGFVVRLKLPQWDQLNTLPTSAKLLAFASLVLWIGSILAGLEVPAFIPI